MDSVSIDRRGLLVAGAGIGVLAACGTDDSASTGTSGADGSEGGTQDQSGETVATVDDVPVGGGFVNQDAKVVVTQPESGDYRAFTAVCTHQGCTVAQVQDNEIFCACHSSFFSAADGSVLRGPAPSSLAAIPVNVAGDDVVRE